MTVERRKRLANYLLFQGGWFACVLGGNQVALAATLTILLVHFIWISPWRKEREIIVICLLLGSAIDSFLGNLNILQFNSDSRLLPLWLACLWVLFGTTLRHSLDWTRTHKLAGSALGLLGGPASYYAGSKLTEVSLAAPQWQTLGVLAIIWALFIPLLQSFSEAWIKKARNRSIQ